MMPLKEKKNNYILLGPTHLHVVTFVLLVVFITNVYGIDPGVGWKGLWRVMMFWMAASFCSEFAAWIATYKIFEGDAVNTNAVLFFCFSSVFVVGADYIDASISSGQLKSFSLLAGVSVAAFKVFPATALLVVNKYLFRINREREN